MVAELLRDEAAKAKGVIETFEPGYPSKATCLEAVDRLIWLPIPRKVHRKCTNRQQNN